MAAVRRKDKTLDVKIEIDKDKVNQAITDAIIESAIGDEMRKQIRLQLDSMSRAYDNPYKRTVETLIADQVAQIFHAEFEDAVAAKIRELMTPEELDRIAMKAFHEFIYGKD